MNDHDKEYIREALSDLWAFIACGGIVLLFVWLMGQVIDRALTDLFTPR